MDEIHITPSVCFAPSRITRRAWTLAIALHALVFWAWPCAAAPRAEVRRDLILLDIDGLDAGQPAPSAAAARAVRFDECFVPSDSKETNALSLLTSAYVPSSPVRFGSTAFSTGTATLPELLRRDGYATAFFTVGPALGAPAGFDHYENAAATATLHGLFEESSRWMRSHRDEPFFLFLRASASSPESALEFGTLWRRWNGDGTLRRAIVVLTSDAGAPGAPSLSDRALRVPLLAWLPDVHPGRIRSDVRLIDVAPSLLDWAGLPAEPAFSGAPLRLLSVDRRPTRRDVFAVAGTMDAGPRKFSLRHDGWKLVYDKSSGTAKLYDLKNDPDETHDRADEYPEKALDLTQRLLRHIRDVDAGVVGRPEPASPALIKALRSHGYW